MQYRNMQSPASCLVLPNNVLDKRPNKKSRKRKRCHPLLWTKFYPENGLGLCSSVLTPIKPATSDLSPLLDSPPDNGNETCKNEFDTISSSESFLTYLRDYSLLPTIQIRKHPPFDFDHYTLISGSFSLYSPFTLTLNSVRTRNVQSAKGENSQSAIGENVKQTDVIKSWEKPHQMLYLKRLNDIEKLFDRESDASSDYSLEKYPNIYQSICANYNKTSYAIKKSLESPLLTINHFSSPNYAIKLDYPDLLKYDAGNHLQPIINHIDNMGIQSKLRSNDINHIPLSHSDDQDKNNFIDRQYHVNLITDTFKEFEAILG
ncbi:uncharacterized protein LOC135932062 isoform X1 [Gordionus sp. m RMFG-2023]|uniref:uncharacterized protein LOC135932062 isoform X1 n=1 Tax=Gordionus sp. m RMFG-2023 TaxID=3053472 RepID=UPI0031FDA987